MALKKGFTLVELLAVIVILAIILAIAIPNITGVINNSVTNTYKSDESLLIRATDKYLILNSSMAPQNVGDTVIIDITQLKNNDFISKIQDAKDSSIECEGYVLVRNTGGDGYQYSPYLKCGTNYVSDTIIQDGLVLNMPLGDTLDGSLYKDLTSYHNNGTNYVTTASPNRFGEENKASSFSDVNSYVDVPNSSSLDIRDAITVSCWTKLYSLDGSYKNLVVKGNEGQQYYWLFLGSSNRIAARTMIGGNGYGSSVTTPIPVNEWMNIAYTYDGHYIKIYKNGVLTGAPYSLTGKMDSTTTSLKIGTRQIYWGEQLAWNFNGAIDDVKIYNRALSENEMKHNYNIESIDNN